MKTAKTIKTLFIISRLAGLVFFMYLGVHVPLVQAETVCSGGNCYYVMCNTNADCGQNYFVGFQTCQQNSIYQDYRTFTCNNPGMANASCTASVQSKLQQTCSGNLVCSAGRCQDPANVTQTNTTNTNTNSNTGNTNTTTTCTSFATRKCVSNISYWYNSCDAIESVAQNCNTSNQVCQSGQCVAKPVVAPAVTASDFVKHYRQQCYQNNIYWYNSQGVAQDVYKSCDDKNSCTQDSCGDLKCSNTLVCDGSTCASGSADFQKYCPNAGPAVSLLSVAPLSIAIFGKKGSQNLEWGKTVSAVQGDTIDFLLAVKNNSASPLNSVVISIAMTDSVEYTGNVKIDNAIVASNITSGFELGMLAPKTSKVISFTGKMKQGVSQDALQINATATSESAVDSDYLAVNVTAQEVKSNFAAALGSSSFINFLKGYWLWIVVSLVLIGLFIIIFRRLSTNV